MIFSDEELYQAVKHYLPEAEEYVKSHGGKIEFLGVKDGVIYIKLAGACGGCSMSLLTTKMVVQKILRQYIHPELIVLNVDQTGENKLPEDVYIPKEDIKKGFFEKIKDKIIKDKDE